MKYEYLILISILLIEINLKEVKKKDKVLKKVRILKKEENSEETEETEDTEEDEAAPTIDYTLIKKENLPQAQMLLPIRRKGTANAKIGVGPCGGIEKKLSNTLTTKGATINFIWEVLNPESSGTCMVRISPGLQDEKNFKILMPLDGNGNKEDGSFLCGREKGFEYKEFKLPPDFECDGCTLQWTWKTAYGDIYSCSDIMINGGNLTNCLGKCLNGGSCFNGECLCSKGFSGDFCENSSESSSKAWLWIFLGLLGAGGAGYLAYWFFTNKSSQGWTTFNLFGKKELEPEEFGGKGNTGSDLNAISNSKFQGTKDNNPI